MLKKYKLVVTILVAFGASPFVQADSTLAYEISGSDGQKILQTISISGRWLRLDTVPKRGADYIIMDLGRLLMFEVNEKEKSFQMTRMGRLYWPSLHSPRFKPVPKKSSVSGVQCQPINEIGMDNKAITKHCMSTGGGLGLNARETITLSRLFMMARRLGQNWPVVATADERQVSILSESINGTAHQFKSVQHGRIDSTKFKVPVGYKRVLPDLPVTTR